MTRQEIIDGIYGCEVDTGFENLMEDKVYELADRILAALEKEREGEVVLGEGELEVGLNACLAFTGYKDLMRKQGQLIFRPTKAKENI